MDNNEENARQELLKGEGGSKGSKTMKGSIFIPLSISQFIHTHEYA